MLRNIQPRQQKKIIQHGWDVSKKASKKGKEVLRCVYDSVGLTTGQTRLFMAILCAMRCKKRVSWVCVRSIPLKIFQQLLLSIFKSLKRFRPDTDFLMLDYLTHHLCAQHVCNLYAQVFLLSIKLFLFFFFYCKRSLNDLVSCCPNHRAAVEKVRKILMYSSSMV